MLSLTLHFSRYTTRTLILKTLSESSDYIMKIPLIIDPSHGIILCDFRSASTIISYTRWRPMPCQLYYPASKSAYLTLNSVVFFSFAQSVIRRRLLRYVSQKNTKIFREKLENNIWKLKKNSAGSRWHLVSIDVHYQVLMRPAFVFVKRAESHLRAREAIKSRQIEACDRVWSDRDDDNECGSGKYIQHMRYGGKEFFALMRFHTKPLRRRRSADVVWIALDCKIIAWKIN